MPTSSAKSSTVDRPLEQRDWPVRLACWRAATTAGASSVGGPRRHWCGQIRDDASDSRTTGRIEPYDIDLNVGTQAGPNARGRNGFDTLPFVPITDAACCHPLDIATPRSPVRPARVRHIGERPTARKRATVGLHAEPSSSCSFTSPNLRPVDVGDAVELRLRRKPEVVRDQYHDPVGLRCLNG